VQVYVFAVCVSMQVCDSLVPRNLKKDLADYFQEQSGYVVQDLVATLWNCHMPAFILE